MFLGAFRTITLAMLELIVLGLVGFLLIRKKAISGDGLKVLSDLVIWLFLPCLMFFEITKRFSPSLYPNWWLYPFLSILMTVTGFVFGSIILKFNKSLTPHKNEFLGITSFQNSGYLPLPLVASLLPASVAPEMFIYIFLFLIGFNMTIFSWGVCILHPAHKDNCFDIKHILNAPVLATLAGLILVLSHLNTFVPEFVMRPIESLGKAAIPLSILVVGGNLASMKTQLNFEWKPLVYSLLVKLVVLPVVFLGIIAMVRPRPLVGLLILLQAAMPPAALLSVISKSHKQDGLLINPAIFYGHVISIVTIPLFLAIFWSIFHTLY